MEVVTQFLGRMHPLFLHLPIGILAVGFAMEWLSRTEKYKHLGSSIGFVLFAGMWSALFAASSGYLLSLEGGYEETTLNRHQWLGIATAVIAFVVFFLHQNFGSLMLLLGITGHLGGNLTHGSDFLTEPFTGGGKDEAVVITNMDNALVFDDLIQPILKKKCVSCHNESKIKGDLLMSTIDGLQKGGKTGPFFLAGDVKNSLFLQRVHMPMEEKKHMPPKGKTQLTEDEITLLEWWVNEGATFEKPVGEIPQTDEIKAVLTKYTTVDQSVFALDIDPPSSGDIQKIKNEGISIELVAEEEPFVTLSLRGNQDLTKDVFRKLDKVAEQAIELDLGKTNMNDEMLAYLENFPHLQKLFLNETEVTGKNLEVLQDMKYLKYLNLYNTPLEDDALVSITNLAALEKLFLWQTNLSPKSIQELKDTRPRLSVNTGIDKEIFGSGELIAPIIVVDTDIFIDSVEVAFDISFKGADLFYTLDGTTPDSTSLKYSAPFIITETSNVKVIAKRKGWVTSSPAERSIVKSGVQAKKVELSQPPHNNYKAEGGATLIDFKKGTIEFTAGGWLGYEKKHMAAILDLGKIENFSSVTVSALEATNSYIFFPKKIKVSVSKDGKNFQSVTEKNIPTITKPEPPKLENFVMKFDDQEARFIKVEVKSNLTNPSWHNAPGEPCWVFVDEILVE